MALFRQQALEAETGVRLGTVQLRGTPSLSIVACVALVLGACLIAFAAVAQVSRKAHMIGVLVPAAGTLSVLSRDAGTIVEKRVDEGQAVRAGDLLVILDSEKLAVGGQGLERIGLEVGRAIDTRIRTLLSQRDLRQRQFELRQRALAERSRILEAKREQGRDEQRLLSRRLQLARASVDRHQALAASGFISAAQVQLKDEELLDVEARLQAARRNLLAIEGDRSELASEKSLLSGQLASDLADIDRSVEAVRQEAAENATRRRTGVTAPFDGVVGAMHLLVGQAVQPGQTLLTLVASGPKAVDGTPERLVAHLYAPSRAIGFVRVGQPVFLRYDAFPYQKFGLARGRVVAVSGVPFAASELPPNLAQQLVARVGTQDALFRALVEVEQQTIRGLGADWPLRAGLMIDADVTQEHRAVWEWILEPLFTLRRTT